MHLSYTHFYFWYSIGVENFKFPLFLTTVLGVYRFCATYEVIFKNTNLF